LGDITLNQMIRSRRVIGKLGQLVGHANPERLVEKAILIHGR